MAHSKELLIEFGMFFCEWDMAKYHWTRRRGEVSLLERNSRTTLQHHFKNFG